MNIPHISIRAWVTAAGVIFLLIIGSMLVLEFSGLVAVTLYYGSETFSSTAGYYLEHAPFPLLVKGLFRVDNPAITQKFLLGTDVDIMPYLEKYSKSRNSRILSNTVYILSKYIKIPSYRAECVRLLLDIYSRIEKNTARKAVLEALKPVVEEGSGERGLDEEIRALCFSVITRENPFYLTLAALQLIESIAPLDEKDVTSIEQLLYETCYDKVEIICLSILAKNEYVNKPLIDRLVASLTDENEEVVTAVIAYLGTVFNNTEYIREVLRFYLKQLNSEDSTTREMAQTVLIRFVKAGYDRDFLELLDENSVENTELLAILRELPERTGEIPAENDIEQVLEMIP